MMVDLANNLTPSRSLYGTGSLLTERSVNIVLCQEEGVLCGVGGWSKKNKKKFIEYNRAYIDYAKQNRKVSTKAEMIFWLIVKNRRLFGYKFKRQKVVWHFILDFYCSELLLWIEIDGWYHNTRFDYDVYRDSEMYKKGIRIVRYKNEDIEKNLSWVIRDLEIIISERKTFYIKEKLKEILL